MGFANITVACFPAQAYASITNAPGYRSTVPITDCIVYGNIARKRVDVEDYYRPIVALGRARYRAQRAEVPSHREPHMSPRVAVLQGERYELQDLAAGNYRLVAKAEDGAPALEFWNQNVTVEAGQVTQLPLSGTNRKVTPDQFPWPAPQ